MARPSLTEILPKTRNAIFGKPSSGAGSGNGDGLSKFGQVLVQYKLISEDQLNQALEFQKQTQNRIGLIIAEKGFADAKEILDIVNRHYRIAATSLKDDISSLINSRRKPWQRVLASVRIPIGVKIAIAMIVLIGITIFTLSSVILNRQAEQLYEATVSRGRLSLSYFEANARIALIQDDTVGLNKLIQDATQQEGMMYAIIVDKEMSIKAHTDLSKVGGKLGDFPQQRHLVQQGKLTYFDYPDEKDRELLDLSTPVTFQSTELGRIHVGVSLDFINEQVGKAKFFILVLSIGFVVLGVVISVLLGVGVSRPISRLVVATREIGKGNFKHRVFTNVNDEVGDLAKSFNFMAEELGQKEQMQKSFGQYVSPEVVAMIMSNPGSSWLKGERREATVIFTDIRGFTAYSETREPEQIVEALNEHFEIATRAILDHGGYVDKFIGDAVMGVFGVPVARSDHAERAVRACLAMQKELQAKGAAGNEIAGKVGIGVNSGSVISGNIGSQVKTEYTVIGDDVNRASRLNGWAGAGETIISESTYNLVKDLVEVVPQEEAKVKGKAKAVKTYLVKSIKEKA
jgi:adenylate cyclase